MIPERSFLCGNKTVIYVPCEAHFEYAMIMEYHPVMAICQVNHKVQFTETNEKRKTGLYAFNISRLTVLVRHFSCVLVVVCLLIPSFNHV